MNLKTYRARTMAEALAQVKKDLGRDAVILHTRTFNVGGWLGLGARQVVEITASTGEAVARERRPVRQVPSAAARAYAAPRPAPPEPEPRPRPEPRREELTPVLAGIDTVAVPSVRASVEEDLASLKRLVGQVLQWSRRTSVQIERSAPAPRTAPHAGAMPDPLFDHYLRLLENDVAAEIADQVVAEVREALPPSQLAEPARVDRAVAERLAALIPVCDTVSRPDRAADGRPLTVALIGPTGVGKTTTVAKLAAAYKLRHGRKVGLITTDTYRIAAVDQLRTYAEIIGLPLKVALTPVEMASACAALQHCDAILIDTAGRSPNDAERLDELRRFIGTARPHETHLVLAGNAGEQALLRAAARFAPAGPDRVIFTKLDEAVNFGVLLNVARRVTLRLSYVTTGQEVPDHIEPGRADRLARIILDNTLAPAEAAKGAA